MDGFFEPPPVPWREQAEPLAPPSWAGRPNGPPASVAVSELVLARSRLAQIDIDYLDAYPEGFELEIRARTSISYHALAREGDDGRPDPFGRHGPMVREQLPAQLLRIGVQFSDGRKATSVGGHDRPLEGPTLWPLGGGGGSRGDESHFHQGYWISPLPPEGSLQVFCEWPVADVAIARRELDARLIIEAAEKASPQS